MFHQFVQLVPFARVPQPFAFVAGDQLGNGLGVPGSAQGGAGFLGGDFPVAVAVEDGVQALLDWALVGLVDHALVSGAFAADQAAQGFEVIGQGAGRAFAVFDEVVAWPLPRAVAGGDHVLFGEPAVDGIAVRVRQQVVEAPPARFRAA
ncbi:hypothetical protein HP532_12610 [Pseudomonas sp. CrR25]|nr:hypothetical protein [Pseudomonas sp. CrR25]